MNLAEATNLNFHDTSLPLAALNHLRSPQSGPYVSICKINHVNERILHLLDVSAPKEEMRRRPAEMRIMNYTGDHVSP